LQKLKCKLVFGKKKLMKMTTLNCMFQPRCWFPLHILSACTVSTVLSTPSGQKSRLFCSF
jgi:hypothetical protein